MGDNHGVTALSLRGWRSNRHPQHSTCSNAAVSRTGKHLFQAFVAGPSGSRTASIDESASTGWRDSGITHLAIPRASLDKVDHRRHQSIILEIHLRRNSCNTHTHTCLSPSELLIVKRFYPTQNRSPHIFAIYCSITKLNWVDLGKHLNSPDDKARIMEKASGDLLDILDGYFEGACKI